MRFVWFAACLAEAPDSGPWALSPQRWRGGHSCQESRRLSILVDPEKRFTPPLATHHRLFPNKTISVSGRTLELSCWHTVVLAFDAPGLLNPTFFLAVVAGEKDRGATRAGKKTLSASPGIHGMKFIPCLAMAKRRTVSLGCGTKRVNGASCQTCVQGTAVFNRRSQTIWAL